MEDTEEPDIEIPTFEPTMPEASTKDTEEAAATVVDPLEVAPPMLLPRGDSLNDSFSAEHVDDSEPDALALVASAEEATGEFEGPPGELQRVEDVPKEGVEVPDEKVGVEAPEERPPPAPEVAAAPPEAADRGRIVESVDDEPKPASAEKEPARSVSEPPLRDGAAEERRRLSRHVGLKEGGPALVVLNKYASLLTRRPCCMITLYLVSVLAFTGALWKQFELEQDFSSFINADGDASRQRDAYLLALDEQEDGRRLRRLQEVSEGERPGPAGPARRGPPRKALEELVTIQEDSRERADDDDDGWGSNATASAAHARRLGTLYIHKELTLAYAARNGNALEEPVLREMHDLESRLRNLPEVQEFSYTGSNVIRRWLGDPGQSLDALAWPSQETGSIKRKHFDVDFDARGSSLLPLPAVLDYMRQFAGNTNHPYNYRRYFQSSYQLPDFGEDVKSSPPQAIRSHFSFYIPVGSSSMPAASISAAVDRVSGEYDDLVKEVFYPMFQNAREDYRHIDVYYEGDVITSYEVEHTLWMDCWYAVGSMLFVTIYMFFHIGKGSPSCSLCSILCNCSFSLVCIFIIFASIPVAYVLTPTAKITVASFLSIFLMAGIGSDVIFVFVDFWEQSKAMTKPEDRVVFTMVHSGRACFATSLTTSVSFFANLASVLKPLREFGLFMGLCVLNAFLLVLLFIPPMLVIRDRRMRRFSSFKVAQEPHDGEPSSSPAWGDDALAVMPETPTASGAHSTCCSKQNKKRRKSQHVGGGGVLFNMVGWISRCPAMLVLCCFILMVIFTVGVVTSAKLDDGSPDIFPPDHNQVIGKETLETFESLPEATLGPPSSASICKAQVMDTVGLADGGSGICDFHWCQAQSEAVSTNPASGVCFRTPTLLREASNARSSLGSTFNGCDVLTVRTRLAAEAAPTTSEWQAAWAPLRSSLVTSAITSQSVQSVQALSTLVQEDWGRGAVNVSHFFSAGEALLLDAPDQDYFAFTFDLGVQFTSGQAAAACQLVQGRVADAVGQGLAAADVICSTWSDFDAAVFAAGNVTVSANAALPAGVAGSSVQVDLTALADGIVDELQASVLGGVQGLEALEVRSVEVENAASQVICEMDTMCFFGGSWPCDLPGWESLGQVTLPERRRRLGAAAAEGPPPAGPVGGARALASAGLVRSPFDVTLVWGIRAPKSTPLVGELDEPWSFDSTFEPSNPWAQRAVLAACESAPATLYIISASQDNSLRPRCWISDFKTWLEYVGRRFPSRDFDEDLQDWISSGTTAKLTAQKHLWMVSGKMRACKIQFHVNMNSDAPSTSVLDFQEQWDEYVNGLNRAASVTANQMYHTAGPWVRAEAEMAIVRSTLDTIIVACVCAWAGMLLFTGDPILSLQVTGLVVIIILGLAFFMVSVMGWKIGAIEVISLVVFVGYSVTYSLHIAHNYSEAQQLGPDFWISLKAVQRRQAKTRNGSDEVQEEGIPSDPIAAARELPPRLIREAQTSMAMQHVGGATLSSAVSTIGSSIFLLFCTLNIFIKLGAVVIAVTGLSVLFALVALPAVLLRFGPPQVPLHRRLLNRLLHRSRGGRGRPSGGAAQGQESPLAPLVAEEVDLA